MLEPQTYDGIKSQGLPTSSWYSAQGGLFSTSPHLVLQEGYWDEVSSTRTERFFVVGGAAGKLERFALSSVAYREAELKRLLSETKLELIRAYPSLLGDVEQKDATTQVFVGTAR